MTTTSWEQQVGRVRRPLSSGFAELDAALGGGYPRGRVVEIFGPESAGKTTLCLHAIASAQSAGHVAAFVDAEHDFDPSAAKRASVLLGDLLLSAPDFGEHALGIVQTLVRSGAVSLVVVDSVGALTPRAEIEGEATGQRARMLSAALRRLTSLAHQTGATVIFVSPLREKIGVVFGSPEGGGNALKFYSSVRLDVRRVEDGVRVRVVKNKAAPPFREAVVDLGGGR